MMDGKPPVLIQLSVLIKTIMEGVEKLGYEYMSAQRVL